jgi:hypothetical protein
MHPEPRQITWFFFATSLLSFLSLVVLLIIPREQGNPFMLGYSLPRTALLAVNFLISCILIALTIKLWRNPTTEEKLLNRVRSWLDNRQKAWFVQILILLGTAFGSFLMVELAFTENQFLKGVLLRLSPIIGFFTLASAHLGFLIRQIIKQQFQPIKITIQIHILVFIWILLSFLWFLGLMSSLSDILIFRRAVILFVSIYIFILIGLDHYFTSDRFSQGFLAVSLLLVMSLSIWVINRFNDLNENTIVTSLLLPAFSIQFIYWVITLTRDKVKQNLRIGNSTLNIKMITIGLGGFATILILIALFFQMPGSLSQSLRNFGELFFLDREMNIPAIFSTALLLIAAGWLFYVFRIRIITKGPFTWYWGFLGAVFVFLSLDELLSFHEGMIGWVRRFAEFGGIFSYEWIIVAIPVIFILGLTYLRFFFHLKTNVRILFFLAATLYLGGSIGGEMLSGWYASKFGEWDANYVSLTIFEETLEMSGIILFIYAIMFYLYCEPLRKTGLESQTQN